MFFDAVAFLYGVKIPVDEIRHPNGKIFGDAFDFIAVHIHGPRVPGTAGTTLPALKTDALIKKIGSLV